jgi:hypothetical protein
MVSAKAWALLEARCEATAIQFDMFGHSSFPKSRLLAQSNRIRSTSDPRKANDYTMVSIDTAVSLAGNRSPARL